ncbi:MAG: cell division topological specificity factor MinE [Clostridia bacterium]|nr:cell division topological specificity factor MinE [Clostridia bacterium]
MLKNNTILRLKRILLSDKVNMPSGLIQLLKKDLLKLFDSYFDIKEESLKIEIDSNADGEYDVSIKGVSERIKSPRFMR